MLKSFSEKFADETDSKDYCKLISFILLLVGNFLCKSILKRPLLDFYEENVW